MRMRVTPVVASPARMAAGTGAAPRWRGSSEGCRFSAPWAWQVEHCRRDETAVVGQHDEAGVEGAQVSEGLVAAKGGWRQDGDAAGTGRSRDRGRAAARPGGRMGGQGP